MTNLSLLKAKLVKSGLQFGGLRRGLGVKGGSGGFVSGGHIGSGTVPEQTQHLTSSSKSNKILNIEQVPEHLTLDLQTSVALDPKEFIRKKRLEVLEGSLQEAFAFINNY